MANTPINSLLLKERHSNDRTRTAYFRQRMSWSVCRNIGDMDEPTGTHYGGQWTAGKGLKLAAIPIELDECGWDTKARSLPNAAIRYEKHLPELGLADAHSIIEHGLQHRLKFAGRGADDTKNVRRRGLLLQRLSEIDRYAGAAH